jgi:hypothetical protein
MQYGGSTAEDRDSDSTPEMADNDLARVFKQQ